MITISRGTAMQQSIVEMLMQLAAKLSSALYAPASTMACVITGIAASIIITPEGIPLKSNKKLRPNMIAGAAMNLTKSTAHVH